MTDLTEIKALLDSMIPKKPVPKDMWVTRDGRRIAIVAMTDKHLVNTLLYLKRKYSISGILVLKDQWRALLPDNIRFKFYKLEDEAIRRGLNDWESRSPIRE